MPLIALTFDNSVNSDVVDTNGHDIVGILCPATVAGTVMNFKTTHTFGGTPAAVQFDGADLDIAIAAGKYNFFSAEKLAGLGLKIQGVSDVAEGAASPEIFYLIARDFRG